MKKQSEKLKTNINVGAEVAPCPEKGITLVALVITIIVLIILAGVSINAVMNQGLITNAKDASGKFNKEKAIEELALTNLEGIMAVENLKEVKAGGYTGTENCKYIEGGRTAVIPAGFTVSKIDGEDTISGGLVIYSGNVAEADWAADTDGIIVAQKNYNQYVWIPVDNPSDMYGILESPVEGIEGTKFGKLYFSTLTDESSECNWPQGSELEYNGTLHREPAVLSSYSAQDSLLKLDEEFDNMIASVEKYKGFYIGRYELSSSGVRKGISPSVSISMYSFDTTCKNLESGNTNAKDKIRTTMIWGCQWDQSIKAILNIGKVTNFLTSPATYGAFDGSTNGIQPTGTKTAAYNIYDMCGNVFDMTLEANGIINRVVRGNDCYYSASNSPASRRSDKDSRKTLQYYWMSCTTLYKIEIEYKTLRTLNGAFFVM